MQAGETTIADEVQWYQIIACAILPNASRVGRRHKTCWIRLQRVLHGFASENLWYYMSETCDMYLEGCVRVDYLHSDHPVMTPATPAHCFVLTGMCIPKR